MKRTNGSQNTTPQKHSGNPCIYELLAGFILRHDIMLEAVATAGEIMAIDARLQDYGGVLSRHIAPNDLGDHLDVYEAMLGRCRAAMTQYEAAKGDIALLRELSEIKQALAELNARD